MFRALLASIQTASAFEKRAMSPFSYFDVVSLHDDGGHDDEIIVGDIVCSGPDLHARFEVITIHGDRAWVRDVLNGANHLALLSHCRKAERRTRPL